MTVKWNSWKQQNEKNKSWQYTREMLHSWYVCSNLHWNALEYLYTKSHWQCLGILGFCCTARAHLPRKHQQIRKSTTRWHSYHRWEYWQDNAFNFACAALDSMHLCICESTACAALTLWKICIYNVSHPRKFDVSRCNCEWHLFFSYSC